MRQHVYLLLESSQKNFTKQHGKLVFDEKSVTSPANLLERSDGRAPDS